MRECERQERLCTASEVAEMLGVSIATVWRHTRSGALPHPIYVLPRMPRWRYSELVELVSSAPRAPDMQKAAHSSMRARRRSNRSPRA